MKFYMRMVKVLWLFVLTLDVARCLASAPVGDKHMLILQSDGQFIWGSYFVGVVGNEQSSEVVVPLLLPEEMVDFQAGDGMEPEDIHLVDGQVPLKKRLPLGNHLMGIGFKVPVRKYGPELLTLVTKVAIPELTIATPTRFGLELSSPGFKDSLPPMLSKGMYRGIQSASLTKDRKIVVQVFGVPKAGHIYQIVALVFGILLFSLGGILTARTRSGDLSHL